jgi:quercetin dioxygenase-like cupin family protein
MPDNYEVKNLDDFETLEGSGNATWHLARKSLGIASFGINIVEIGPDGQIPEHDETERDQEEVFIVLEGEATFVIDGEEHPAPAGTFARLAPLLQRMVKTGEKGAKVMIISAPTGSGYIPMTWA